MAGGEFAILTDEHIHRNIVTQLRARGMTVERVEDTVGKSTLDPKVLDYAYNNGLALLTHDESIGEHITERFNDGKGHAGVFIAPNHLRGSSGIGRIVAEMIFWHEAVASGAASLENDVYNTTHYIS